MSWFSTPDRGALYGVFDAARSREVLPTLLSSGEPCSSLFEERPPAPLKGVAPYIVRLDQSRGLGHRSLVEGWGTRWGIFVRAPTHLEGVRRQLRRSLMARDPNGRTLLFRFYDPRILRLYLPTCTPAELSQFFGGIEAFYAFDDDEPVVDAFTRDQGGKLVVDRREVSHVETP